MLLSFSLLFVLLLNDTVDSMIKVKPEYLRKGRQRYFFNSCPCGEIDGEQQDLSSERAKNLNKKLEKKLLDSYGKVRKRRKRSADLIDLDLGLGIETFGNKWRFGSIGRRNRSQDLENVLSSRDRLNRVAYRLMLKTDGEYDMNNFNQKGGSKLSNSTSNPPAPPLLAVPRHFNRVPSSFNADESSILLPALEEDGEDEDDLPPTAAHMMRKLGRKGRRRHKKKRPKKRDRVINGLVAKPGQAPWQVLLENTNSGEICGGAIINKRKGKDLIATQTHCTENFRKDGEKPTKFPQNILAVVRQPRRCSGKFLSSRYKADIAKVHDHPKYKRLPSQELVYDFSLLETKKPMDPFNNKDLSPICLPPKDLWEDNFVGDNVKISGYGRTTRTINEYYDTTSCVLKLGLTNVISPDSDRCNPIAHSPSVQICGWDPKVDACAGDSGGPLILADQNKFDKQILIGVVSYGSAVCAHERAAGVYAKVSKVMRWILVNIQKGECVMRRKKGK